MLQPSALALHVVGEDDEAARHTEELERAYGETPCHGCEAQI